MAPSVGMDIDPSIQMDKKKRKKSKDLPVAVEHVEDSEDSNKKKKKKKKKNKESGSVKEGDEAALIQLVAKYLDKRNLRKTLSSFLSETQCENSWKTQTIDLEDIFNQYSNHDSEKLKKHNVENINNHVNEASNLKLQEQELKPENANKVVNSKVEPVHKRHLSASGFLKPQVSGSDSSSDDSEDEVAVSKKKNSKEPKKDGYSDSEKIPKQTNSGKQGNLLQESLEVMKEEKKKGKKNPKDKDLIDSDEQKTSIVKEKGDSRKDNSKPSKAKRKQRDSENLGESLQELLEVPQEEKKKKKKNKIENKDVIDNDGVKTSVVKEKTNSNKDDSKPSKTLSKQIGSGKVDGSSEEKRKKKKKNSVKGLINNDELETSNGKEKGNAMVSNGKPSKAKESKNVLDPCESLQESLKVAKDKEETEDVEGKDSSNNDRENGIEKTKKEKFKKLETSCSNVITEEPTTKNLKDLTEDTDNPFSDTTTPLNKKGKANERKIDVSSNSKQNSVEPTTAKAFQRVKLEEVEFVDPRLQDNSYWAKSGADAGYGAKAEQVLGQVRGKDFRHEKTKKKRGSYKGGMIDLQSHSIKFSYSDEE